MGAVRISSHLSQRLRIFSQKSFVLHIPPQARLTNENLADFLYWTRKSGSDLNNEDLGLEMFRNYTRTSFLAAIAPTWSAVLGQLKIGASEPGKLWNIVGQASTARL